VSSENELASNGGGDDDDELDTEDTDRRENCGEAGGMDDAVDEELTASGGEEAGLVERMGPKLLESEPKSIGTKEGRRRWPCLSPALVPAASQSVMSTSDEEVNPGGELTT
jgi:hypothetical protein